MKSDNVLRTVSGRGNICGVSLIELMVSLVIGLFLVLGATTLYVNSRKTADIDDATARLQETARYAMNILESDVRMANYWGLMKYGSAISGKANAAAALSPLIPSSSSLNTCENNFVVNTDNSISATNNNYAFTDIAGSCSPQPGSAVTSADTLTIRRAATIGSSSSSSSSSSSLPSMALDTTMLQLCSTPQATAFIASGSTCASATSNTGAIYNMEVNAYYVDQQSTQSTAIPSLRKKTLISGPTVSDVEITPGVEDMQVQLGWDSNNSGNSIS